MATRTTDQLKHKPLLAAIAKHQAAGTTGKFSDGRGLSLVMTAAGHCRWVHKFQWKGRTIERWLAGEYPDETSLAQAREVRDADRQMLRDGINPVAAAKRAAVAAKGVPTFAEYAKAHVAFLAPKTLKARKTWLRQMTGEDTEGESVGALAAMPIDAIALEHVKGVILPLWFSKPTTAKELCDRIRRVIDHRETNARPDSERRNPAEFARIERKAIGKPFWSTSPSTVRRCPIALRCPAFLAKLSDRPSLAARVLEMVVATGCRVNEITGLRWCEIDWRRRVIVIPATRMKAQDDAEGEAHVVPLTRQMVAVLRRAVPPTGIRKPTDLVFPNRKGNPFHSKDILVQVWAVSGGGPATTHGFRSAFTDWGTSMGHRRLPAFDHDLMQVTIAHKIGNTVSQAYQRDRWLDRRRAVYREWSVFCSGAATAVVIPFRRVA